MSVGAIILAAGRSTRMGRPKVLLPWQGRPLLGHVTESLRAAGIAPLLVVVGPDTPALPELPGIEVLRHPEARQGLGTSLAAGAAALRGRVRALLVCLGDQPGIDPAVIAALVAALHGPHLAAAPVYRGGVRGHPVLFSAALLPELVRLQGDRGARAVLEAHPTVLLPVDAPAPPDIDTPGDYDRLREGGGAP